jgi:phosphatidylglycerophosphatase A
MTDTAKTAARFRFRHPVTLIATWFGSGLLRPAPGTWGTLAALPPAYVIARFGGPVALVIAIVVAFAIGVWAANAYARAAEKSDPSEVVIDEVAAMWLVLAAAPPNWLGWLLAFVAFRFFDVLKPWPVNLADIKLKGGFGIMIDDIIAAFYAILALQILNYLVEAH